MTGTLPQLNLRDSIDPFLAGFRGQRVLLYPNPGNAGDCLILAGTIAALEKGGVAYDIIDARADVTGRTVFVGGGGNLVPLYRDISDALERFLPRAARIVLLPHTIRGHARLLRRLDERVSVLCREAESLAYVQRVNPRVKSMLAHDMAFHLDADQVLARTDLAAGAMPIVEAALADAGFTLASLAAMPRARFMRTDKESRGTAGPGDIDLSAVLGNVSDAESAAITTWSFLRIVSAARHIETDRLHVAIAAALCGVPCDLHDNTYGKNRAMFAASLRNFPNVDFIACPQPSRHWERLTPDERATRLRKGLRLKRIVTRFGFWAARVDGAIARGGLPKLSAMRWL